MLLVPEVEREIEQVDILALDVVGFPVARQPRHLGRVKAGVWGRELQLGPQAPVFGQREFQARQPWTLRGNAGDLPS